MATYLSDIESARNFVPQNQYTDLLEQYRRKSKKPTLREIEFNRPGSDTQGFYNRLDLVKRANEAATGVALTQALNRRAAQALADAQSYSSLQYDLSGITPRYTLGINKGKGTYGSPIQGARQSSGYGTRRDPFTGRSKFHTGIDFAAPAGTPIYATHDGRVSFAGWNKSYGNQVILAGGGGISTMYGHQSRLAVKPGQYVTRGQLIGYVGSTGRSTGNHLHYTVMMGGRVISPAGYY